MERGPVQRRGERLGALGVLCVLAVSSVAAEVTHDDVFWESVAGCTDAVEVEMYLEEFPQGRHVREARACLERLGVGDKSDIEGLLELCEVHFEANRLTTGVGGTAVACYEEVLSRDRGNRQALEGLERVMQRYAEWGHAVLGRGEAAKARGYLDKMQGLNPEAAQVRRLRGALEEWERARAEAEEKERAERERLARERQEAEERKRREKTPGRRFRDCAECPELVVVPAGTFRMGSPSHEEGRDDDEGPVHEVRIAEPFAVGVHEVTFSEWEACVNAGGCGGHRPDDAGWGRGNRPVIDVSWEDAQAYVRWLSRRTGERYRLPSESEWEYVARAGTTTPFHFGSTISTEQANYDGNYTYGAGREGRYWNKAVPVGSFPAKRFGLHDVHGNVWEWVQDCWNESYHGAPRDGSAWERGACSHRILRGGSWYELPWYLRSANRHRNSAGNRLNQLGFRIARTLTP